MYDDFFTSIYQIETKQGRYMSKRQPKYLDDENLYQQFEQEELKAKILGPKNKSLTIQKIEPITENQKLVFDCYKQNFNLLLHGCAGTGKSFVAIYLALKEVLDLQSEYKQLIIVRNVLPIRDCGFLPGTLEEKIQPLETPYHHMFYELFGLKDAFKLIQKKGIVGFQTTSYIRGITINNSIILVDECQNLNFHELDTIITRMGQNSKIIFSGDFNQTDLVGKDKNGILEFMDILKSMDSFQCVEFGFEDIVRSGFVKEYLIAKSKKIK